MDWDFYWRSVLEGYRASGGMMTILNGLIPLAAGAIAAHLLVRSQQRTIWAPIGVALLANAGLWTGIVIAYSLTELSNDHPATYFIISFPSIVLLPLLGALFGIRRGYKCSWYEYYKATFTFAIVVFAVALVGALLAPNYIRV